MIKNIAFCVNILLISSYTNAVSIDNQVKTKKNEKCQKKIDFKNNLFEDRNFIGYDFRNKEFNGSKFINVDFTRANLNGSKFENVVFTNVNFFYANLKESCFNGCKFNFTSFNYANLSEAYFTRSTFYKSNFECTKVENTTLYSDKHHVLTMKGQLDELILEYYLNLLETFNKKIDILYTLKKCLRSTYINSVIKLCGL